MNVIFALLISPERTEFQAALLASSIRAFGARFNASLIWFLLPELGIEPRASYLDRLESLDVQLHPFQVPQVIRAFPFALKVLASAEAERLAVEQADILVWMDTGSLVVNAPEAVLLKNGIKLGYRPVDHTLIGSVDQLPIDPFWAHIFETCKVPDARLFEMKTSVDEVIVRPYFNAGMLVVRPGEGIFQAWCDNFTKLYAEDTFEAHYRENELYKIFIHQAVLAGTILNRLGSSAMQELPHLLNYPLHMHTDYPPDLRPRSMNEIITLRYEGFFDEPSWREQIEVQEPLLSWLEEQLASKKLE